jgi:hypothetical protein
MAILLKRQLTDSEKADILKQHGRMCFATGHQIPDDETIQFDHIKAYSAASRPNCTTSPQCALNTIGRRGHSRSKISAPSFE